MLPWGPCVDDPTVNVAHEMGFYEAIWSLGMFVIFWFLDKRPRTPGLYAAALGLAYGPVRFALDFARPETTDVRYLGLTPAQYGFALLTLGCVGVLGWLVRNPQPAYWNANSSPRDRKVSED